MRARLLATAFCFLALMGEPASSQMLATPGDDVRLIWEVKNRFRLFRMESDFRHHAIAAGETVLAAEQRLAAATGGRGWARTSLNHLCFDAAGRLAEPCERDGVSESFLAPKDHRIGLRLAGPVPESAACTLNLDDGEGEPRRIDVNCRSEAALRVRYGKTTVATMEIATPDGLVRTATADLAVRDLLIAGLGDSVASGEGNPDRPIALADESFCFHQFVSGPRGDYFRPSRAGFKGDKSCDLGRATPGDRQNWAQLGARWMSQACHRSLYGYQVRTALALAAADPHVAVTFLPLACTGATIEVGLFNSQRARELNCGASKCPSSSPGQIPQLQELLAGAKRRDPSRKLDLVLLTVGANDIGFSGLVGDVIIEPGAERVLFGRGGVINSVEYAESVLTRQLPRDFARLRDTLKPLLGGDLSRVVYVSYGHPALGEDGNACPGGRDGFDIHPSFSVDPGRIRRVADFVRDRFLPQLKALATCTGGALCKGAEEEMTFVDTHQPAFVGRGFCARSENDPAFDRECFKADGASFPSDLVRGAAEPLTCGLSPKEFRPYAPRARWIRTANDSYFAAMTYPEGLPSTLQPSDIHDATWGVLSAVYGGAVHPTAEGHAAMADAALPEVRRLLGLSSHRSTIVGGPLPEPTLPALQR